MKTRNEFYTHCCFLNGDYCRWKKQDCLVLYSKAGECESFRKGQPLKTVVIDEMRKNGIIPDGVGKIVPLPEEIRRERDKFQKALAPLHKNSFSVIANIFTMAIVLQRDFYADLAYCERAFEYLETTSNTPTLETSLQFLALLADKMNCPISMFFSMAEENRKKVIYDLIGQYKKRVSAKQALYEYEGDFEEELTQETDIRITLEDLASGLDFREHGVKQEEENDEAEPYYEVVLARVWDEEKSRFVYSLSYMPNWTFYLSHVDFQFMYTGCEIYTEFEGELADLIEQIIKNETPDVTKESIERTGTGSTILPGEKPEETETYEDKTLNQERETHRIEKPEEKDSRGKVKREVLTKHIYNDTRTIDLLDEFEGIGENNPYVYEMLEIPSAMYLWKNNQYLTLSLVVKRCRASDCVGDITFTEFKQDKVAELKNYVSQQITDNVVERYHGKRDIFYFDKPYHLRAQNSSNRTGYGWEWDWSGGVGDYIEGTLYGETTDYGFVGVYIK